MSDIQIALLVAGLAVGGVVGWTAHAWFATRKRKRELSIPNGASDPTQRIPLSDEDLDRLGGVLTSAHLAAFRRSTKDERPRWAEEKSAERASTGDGSWGSRGDL